MSKRGDINLDDVLDFYLTSIEETGKDTLDEMIKQYPQFEDQLRDFAAFRNIGELTADRVYSAEEEDLVKARAVSAVQNVLYQRRTQTTKRAPRERGSVIAARAKPRYSDRSTDAKAAPEQTKAAKHRARRHFARAVLSAEIVERLHNEPTFGRVKHHKVFHICEHVAQLEEIEGEYQRKAAGPLDHKLIFSVEDELQRQKWFETYELASYGHGYRQLSKAGGHRIYFTRWWPQKGKTVVNLIELMRPWTTQQCEIFSTVYAAWNDLVISGKPVTDDLIITEVLERWHEKKKAITEDRWRAAIAWMRKKGFAPTGFGRATIINNTPL